jgi:NAD(P)-dependent dehydrogenase (short-subunit alcohol dehydrogenase family)
MGRLDGKVAIITGSASGMGAATCRLFAREGASVVGADVNEEGGRAVVDEIVAQGLPATFVRTDVTEEADIVAMIAAAVDAYGRLDVLFNNAGGAIPGSAEGETSIERYTAEDWEYVHALNVRAMFLAIKHALPHLRAAGGGSIISTGSDAGLRGLPENEAYNVFKAGVHMLTQCLAQDLGRYHVRVNAIAPGWIGTPMTLQFFPPDAKQTLLPLAQPIPRAGEPEDIANAALFFASDESSFVSGVVMQVDGGWLSQGSQNTQVVQYMASGAVRPQWMEQIDGSA